MRRDGVLTRRTCLSLGVSLAVLGSATMASAQAMPPPPPAPDARPAQPAPTIPAPPGAPNTSTPRSPTGAPAYPGPGYPPPMMIGPSRLPYNDNDPIPMGYEIKTHPRWGMVKAGIATFAPLYGLSVLFGGVYLGNTGNDAQKYGPMLIPVIGPFATIGTADTSFGTPFLLLDGLGQLTGGVLIIAGLLSDEKYLAAKTASAKLRPEVSVGPKSFVMRWQF